MTHRQSARTTLPELVGHICDRIAGIQAGDEQGLVLLFISIDGGWHRVFTDEGVLFWALSEESPSTQLSDQERIVDLLNPATGRPPAIRRIEYADGCLEISLEGGIEISLAENPNTGLLERTQSSTR